MKKNIFIKIACIIGIIVCLSGVYQGKEILRAGDHNFSTANEKADTEFGADFYTEVHGRTAEVGEYVSELQRQLGFVLISLSSIGAAGFLVGLAAAFTNNEPERIVIMQQPGVSTAASAVPGVVASNPTGSIEDSLPSL